MGLIDFFFGVEMSSRESAAAMTRHEAELQILLGNVRRRKEEEARRTAEETARRAREHPGREEDVSLRFKRTLPENCVASLRLTLERSTKFSSLLVGYVRERCEGRASVCYRRAGISRQLYSHLVSHSRYVVEKETVLRLAIGLQLSFDEAVDFLRVAGYAFSDSDELDVVFSYCIRNGIYSIFDVNDLLVALGQPALTIR